MPYVKRRRTYNMKAPRANRGFPSLLQRHKLTVRKCALEKKYHDRRIDEETSTQTSPTPVAGDPLLLKNITNCKGQWYLNNITQGSGVSNRIGNNITIISIQARLKLYMRYYEGAANSAGAGVQEHKPTTVRIMLVWDKQPNAVATFPAFTDIIETDTYTAIDAHSFMNMANRQRFKVIKDWQVCLGSTIYESDGAGGIQSACQMGPGVYCVNLYKKCNLRTNYGATTGAISDVNTGSLLLYAFADGGGNGIYMLGKTRLRFLDS